MATPEKNLYTNIFHIDTNMIIQRALDDLHLDNIIKRSGSDSYSRFHARDKTIKPQK